MFHKFWMVVRDNGTSSCTKRWQDIQEAREEAMRLCRKERVPFVVLEAMERISLEEKETPVKIERLCDVPAKTYTKEEILAEFLKVPEEEREIGNMDDLKQLIGKKGWGRFIDFIFDRWNPRPGQERYYTMRYLLTRDDICPDPDE